MPINLRKVLNELDASIQNVMVPSVPTEPTLNLEVRPPMRHRGTTIPEQIKRDPLVDYEMLYVGDPVIFNSINIIVALVNAGWFVEGADESVRKEFETFLIKQCQFDDAISWIAMCLGVYGVCYTLLGYNAAKEVAGWFPLDPKSVDYLKDPKSKKYMFDEYGEPKGYVQDPKMVEQKYTQIGAVDYPMWEITNQDKATYLAKEDVLEFGLRRMMPGQRGLSLIHPIRKITWLKLNLEEALGENIYHTGFPLYLASVGDKDGMDPDPAKMGYANELLKDISNQRDVILPYWIKFDVVEPKGSPEIANALNYWVNMQIAGLGVSKPFALGTGEGTNRSTVEYLSLVGDKNVQAIQTAIQNVINNKLLERWAETRKITLTDKNRPVLKFRLVGKRERAEVIRLMIEATNAGLITPTPKTEAFIRDLLNAPVISEDEFAPVPKAAPAGAPPKKPVDDEEPNPDDKDEDDDQGDEKDVQNTRLRARARAVWNYFTEFERERHK